MFNRRSPPRDPVRIRFEDRDLVAERGESVAAALLAGGAGYFRETPVSGARRTAFCMIGKCFECLVVIDGRANRQACMTRVEDGMQVQIQRGARAAHSHDS